MLKMSMPSVIKVSQQLMDKQVLVMYGEMDTSLGRKPLVYRLNPEFAYAVGVMFDHNRLTMGIVNLDGEIQYTTSSTIHTFDDSFANSVIEGIQKMKRRMGSAQKAICGIGIALPGVVNPKECVIEFAPLMGIDRPFDASKVVNKISQELGLPVLLENDVNMCAVGEMSLRSLDKNADLVYISMGAGVGCGIILQGELRRGKNRLCGEIGYFVQDTNWVTKREETGWLESVVHFEKLRDLFERKQEVLANEYISQYVSPIIANITMLLDVNDVIVGGLLVETFGETLVERIHTDVNRLALNQIQVEKSLLSDPGIVGVAKMMLESKLYGLI